MTDKPRTYGIHSKTPENPKRCIKEVYGTWLSYQCTRKRGYGKDGLYCKQHAKRYPAEEQKP